MLGQACVSASDECPSGFTLCGEVCVDLGRDPGHCGSRGAACSGGEVCSQGSCFAPCDSPFDIRCDGTCVDPSQSVEHCGTCGNACAPGVDCFGGECR